MRRHSHAHCLWKLINLPLKRKVKQIKTKCYYKKMLIWRFWQRANGKASLITTGVILYCKAVVLGLLSNFRIIKWTAKFGGLRYFYATTKVNHELITNSAMIEKQWFKVLHNLQEAGQRWIISNLNLITLPCNTYRSKLRSDWNKNVNAIFYVNWEVP